MLRHPGPTWRGRPGAFDPDVVAWYNSVRLLYWCSMELQPSQQRRLERRTHARRAILEGTEALLLEEGYERFSMRRLAARCGYTAPTIYHYFGDKPGLIHALLEERFAEVLERLRGVPVRSDPVESLRCLASELIDFGLRNPTHYRLLSLPRGGELSAPPSAEEAIALVQQPLRQLAAEKRLTTTDVEAAFQVIWAAVHGIIHLRITRPDYEWSTDLPGLALESLTRGLVVESSGP
jgi:AcrR family transcriptional regulator